MIELLTAVVIIGILAAIAMPNYLHFVEKARADQAITYLKVIRTGELIYFANNDLYVRCDNATDIKTNLGVEITTEYYTFTVLGNSSLTTSFIATARRNNGGATITLTNANTWGGTSTFRPSN